MVKAAVWALKNKGRAAFIYPAVRGATILYELKKQGLEPKRLQTVYSYPGSPATLLLIEAVKGGGEELSLHGLVLIFVAGCGLCLFSRGRVSFVPFTTKIATRPQNRRRFRDIFENSPGERQA